MTKRYYLSKIIGDGTEDNPFRPALADAGVSWIGSIPSGEDGRPLRTFALCLVATQNHAVVRAQADTDPLPDFPLDGKVGAINAATKALMKAALNRRGLNADAIVDSKDGYREVIRAIGKNIDPIFDENSFDLTDV